MSEIDQNAYALRFIESMDLSSKDKNDINIEPLTNQGWIFTDESRFEKDKDYYAVNVPSEGNFIYLRSLDYRTNAQVIMKDDHSLTGIVKLVYQNWKYTTSKAIPQPHSYEIAYNLKPKKLFTGLAFSVAKHKPVITSTNSEIDLNRSYRISGIPWRVYLKVTKSDSNSAQLNLNQPIHEICSIHTPKDTTFSLASIAAHSHQTAILEAMPSTDTHEPTARISLYTQPHVEHSIAALRHDDRRHVRLAGLRLAVAVDRVVHRRRRLRPTVHGTASRWWRWRWRLVVYRIYHAWKQRSEDGCRGRAAV